MKPNLASLDRSLRAVLGLVLLVLAWFVLAEGLRLAAALVGVVLLGTAAVRFCPLYRLLGISTRRARVA